MNADTSATSVTFTGSVIIEGETWRTILTPDEYAAWDRYATTHPHLLSASYGRTLEMFLGHFRRGLDLNQPLSRPSNSTQVEK